MPTNPTIKELLDIPKGYKLASTQILEGEIHVKLSPTKSLPWICSGCQGQSAGHGYHSSDEVTIRDLPVVGRAVYLHVQKRKYRCPVDGRIYVEELDWVKKKADIPVDLLKRYTV